MTKTAVAKGSVRGATGPTGPGFLGTFQVRDFATDPNAAGSGLTGQDDGPAIRAAIAAALAYRSGLGGGKVLFDSGTWQYTTPIDQPEVVSVQGIYQDTITYSPLGPPSPCVIQPPSTFVGEAIWRLRGRGETGRTNDHTGARLAHLTFDGSFTPAATKGIKFAGLVREAEIDHVTVRDTTDTGIDLMAGTTDSSKMPQSCRVTHCLTDGCGNNGFRFQNVPDSTVTDCNSLGATNSGFRFEGFMNGQVSNIRAEWSGQHGILLTSGYWGSGQGSGGCILSNISTDRNGMNGVFIDATGSAAIQINGTDLRRDGRNNGTGGGSYAGLNVASTATMPVIVDNIQVYPGVDDDGSGTLSPQYGVYVSGTNPVVISSGEVFPGSGGDPFYSGGGLILSEQVQTTTGTTAAPVRWPIPGPRNFAGDTTYYGDLFSTMERADATGTAPIANGQTKVSTGIVTRAGRATKIRMCTSTTGAAGTGSVQVVVCTGTSLANLSVRATVTSSTLYASGTLIELTLSNTVVLQPGMMIAIFVYITYSTVPNWQGLPAGGGYATMISPAVATMKSGNKTGAPPSTTIFAAVNLTTSGYTASGTPMWLALAP